MKRLSVASAIAVFALSAILGWSQSSTTSLRGTVVDPQGAVVVGASVTLTNPSTAFSQSTATDKQGGYQFLQLPPGTYMLSASMAGFGTVRQENLRLLVDVSAWLTAKRATTVPSDQYRFPAG